MRDSKTTSFILPIRDCPTWIGLRPLEVSAWLHTKRPFSRLHFPKGRAKSTGACRVSSAICWASGPAPNQVSPVKLRQRF